MEDDNKVSIEFSDKEATQLIKIIDFAVKQVGIADGGEMANNSIYFLNKINNSFKEKNGQDISAQ